MIGERLDPERIYNAEDVARIVFGISADRFYRRRKAEERKTGFPKPISPIGRPRWWGHKLLDWLDRPEQAPSVKADSGGGNVVDYSAKLKARLEALKNGAGGRGPRRAS